MEKLRIAICDDDPVCLNSVKNLTQHLCQKLNISVDVLLYNDGADLTEHYPDRLDALFLDIEMPFVDGLDAARIVRGRDSQVLLVFMSNYEKYAIQGYEFGAWRYLLKPISQEQFDQEMQPPLEELIRKDAHILYIRNDHGFYTITCPDLLYASTNTKKNIDLHMKSQTIECYQSLSSLEDNLAGCNFFRCHSGFLVNLAYVSQIGQNSLRLQDSTDIPVSKHRRKELINAFLSYAGTLL